MSDLVKTVPSSASYVVAVNMHDVLEKAGCKVSDNGVKPGKEIQEILDKNGTEFVSVYKEGNGVDPSGLIVFQDAYASYSTFHLADVAAFKKSVEEREGGSFIEVDGVSTNGRYAVCGVQAWILNGPDSHIDAKAVKSYSELVESQSFLSNPVSARFSEMKHDVEMWGLISQMSRLPISGGNELALNMATGMMFDNLACATATIDFEKGKVVGEMELLNGKGKPAKYLLPDDKVDVETIKAAGESGDMVIAFALPKSLGKKIEKLAEPFNNPMINSQVSAVKEIDGTVAIDMSESGTGQTAANVVVTPSKDASSVLLNTLSNFGTVKKEEKYVRVTIGDGAVAGAIDMTDAADFLKGSTMGLFADSKIFGNQKYFKTIGIALVPSGDSVKVRLVVKGNDDSSNILLSVVKAIL